MIAFLQQNLATILLSLALLAALFFVVRSLVRRTRAHDCGCGGCGSCPYGEKCGEEMTKTR